MSKNKIIFTPVINTQCTGCGKCVQKCRHGVLEMKNELGRFYARTSQPDNCRGCEKCRQVCPTDAIHILTKEIINPSKTENKMNRSRMGGHFLHMIFFILLFLGGVSAIVMLLWNALIPGIIGWGAINYWQALGLLVLCQLLFRGIWPHHWLNREHAAFHREGTHLHEKIKGMNWEERREYIRHRMAGFHDTEKDEAGN